MIVEHKSPLSASAEAVFAWHARPGAFERLVPPWEHVRLVEPHPGLEPNARVVLEMGSPIYRSRWIVRHTSVEPGRGFTDELERGPFARWRHEHRFEPTTPESCELVDRIDFELKGGPLGELADPFARRRTLRALRYRHRTTAGDLAMHSRYRGAQLRVALTGASGLIGSAVKAALQSGGHVVVPMVRRAAQAGEISWDPEKNRLDPASLSGIDAVIHLAGESIAGSRWTARHKERIRRSRVDGTALVANAIARANPRPTVFVSGSAMGFYGDRGEEILEETSGKGSGFLPEVATAWEAAAEPARQAGVRTIHPRFAIVLSPAGGMLKQINLPFKLGAGGPLGNGRQWLSWVAIDDVIGALIHCLRTEAIVGPVNVAAPVPIRNADFASTIGKVLRRPAIVSVPAFALRLVFDGLADEGLLASARLHPGLLEATGYTFRYGDLETALRHLYGRGAP